MKKILLLAVYSFCLLHVNSFAQKVTNYLGVPGTILINGAEYDLAWSSHPTSNYYKQEYLAKGDTLERYRKLIMLDVFTGEVSPEQAVSIQVKKLEELKKSNPVVNYRVMEKGDEFILDFLMSENSADGESINIIERNVYRYLPLKGSGQKGVVLFAISERAYDNIESFLNQLKEDSYELINTVGGYTVPKVVIE